MADPQKPGSFELPYSGKFKKASAYDYPRFTLAKKDERAIIMLIDQKSTCAFIHWVVTGTRIDQKTQIKGSKGNYFVCLGDPQKLMHDEPDTSCPFCASAEDIDGAAVGLARFKACAHVIHYATTPQGTVAAPPGYPPQFMLKAWVFGQQTYNLLADKQEAWGEHAFRHHDLMVTCVSPQYQNVTMETLPKALWLEPQYTKIGPDKRPTEGLAIQIAQLYQQARLKDMTPLLGRVCSIEEANKHIAAAKKYTVELGGTGGEEAGLTPEQVEANLNAHGAAGVHNPAVNIDDLFGGGPATQPAPPVVPTQPIVTQTPVQSQQPVQSATNVQVSVTQPPTAGGSGDVNFDDLLG